MTYKVDVCQKNFLSADSVYLYLDEKKLWCKDLEIKIVFTPFYF